MTLAGRYPSPTSIRAEKRRRKRELPQNVELPTMPADLSAEAKRVWRALVPKLAAAGVPLRKVDAASIASYCVTIAHVEEIESLAAAETSIQQKLKLLRFAKALRKDASQQSDRFGGSPTSRLRLGVQNVRPPNPDNPWRNI